MIDAKSRPWHVAAHPYTLDGGPKFSDADRPTNTPGTLSLLTGWLQAQFPQSGFVPSVMLTESSITSGCAGCTEQQQADAICESYRQALASPGIEGYVYAVYEDDSGGNFGLVRKDGSQKPSWNKWATMNAEGTLDCGFEHQVNGTILVKLARYRNNANQFWVTPRNPNAYGFVPDLQPYWLLPRDSTLGMAPIYDCQVPNTQDHFLSPDNHCEGQFPNGMVGYAPMQPTGNYNIPMYRCIIASTGQHFVSIENKCEGLGTSETLLGFGSH